MPVDDIPDTGMKYLPDQSLRNATIATVSDTQKTPFDKSTMTNDDTFHLYDLRVEVVVPEGKRILCGAKQGDYFTMKGEMMYLPPGQGISVYSLASVLPLLACKQRMTHEHDWMTTDSLIACPDPCCPSQLRIVRTGVSSFRHSETTAVSLEGN
ncbi:hypothetical protein BJY04DRAFT_217888 [Aspergillus karnatakaensis]|uniref:TIGR04076 family protein n=1 Tax=Aspergillus karnatakaensis TaxID=1810916 RepID=UPI003CCD9D97